ncbi:MAG: HAD family hydrolase [Sphaerochaeta sp.]|uniref:HAD family hydrolase n=1 Tax=Sphaerochaeta sp. TaxID=1972642 RepID=UPI002FCBDD60
MHMPDFKAVVFDLDGTLVDTIGDIQSALASALQRENLPAPEEELVRKVVGNGLPNSLRGVLANFGHTVSPARFETLLGTMMAYYRVHYADKSRPYEGIMDLLQRLADDTLLIGILSNKEDGLTQSIVRTLFPSTSFAWVQGLRSDVPRKPDRSAIDSFCTRFRLSPQELLFVGDSEVDWQTAQNAGCPHRLVSWGFRPKEELQALPGAVVVDTVQALEDAIYGLQRKGSSKQS